MRIIRVHFMHIPFRAALYAEMSARSSLSVENRR